MRSLIGALLLGLVACDAAPSADTQKPETPQGAAQTAPTPAVRPGNIDRSQAGKAGPAAAFVDRTEKPLRLAAFAGQPVLVNLWATWCAPCIKELPSLGMLQQELGGDQFQVVTIAIDERDPAKIEPFLATHGAATLPVLIDRDRTIETVAQVIALPTSLLVDRDGKVKAMVTGDACWNSGTALAAVKAFITDGTVLTDELKTCE